MLAKLVAETTDGPVWALVAATFMLVVVTGVLAGAAIMALRELDEAKTDRHVQVVTSLAARWNGEMLVSALSAEQLFGELGRTGDPYSYKRFEALVARMSDIPDV
jgi:hypothetical protein